MGTFPITVPYTFATATSPIPLNKLDTDFTTLVTSVNGISDGTYPLASPAIQGGTMSGTITLSGTITGSSGAVNPGTVSTTGSITAGTTISASGTITSSSTVQGTAVTATTGNITATAGNITANAGVIGVKSTQNSDPGTFPQLQSTGGYNNLNLSSTTGFSWDGNEVALGTNNVPAIAIKGNGGSPYFKVLSPLVPYATQANFTVISDITEKTDVAALSMSTQRIMSLKPVSFTWINDGFKDSGFIAQDFETVYPQNVHDVDGKKHIGIDMNFYADLVATIQELRTELDALKAKVGA
jgi:hypothetical protein